VGCVTTGRLIDKIIWKRNGHTILGNNKNYTRSQKIRLIDATTTFWLSSTRENLVGSITCKVRDFSGTTITKVLHVSSKK